MNPTFQDTISFLSKYNRMSHPVNTSIEEEIADMIAHLRPDLAEEEANVCFHDCLNVLQDDGQWSKEIVQTIAAWGRGGNDEEPV